MKAILIDVKNNTVSDVEVSDKNTLKEWYNLIDCELVTVAAYIDAEDHDSIIVDDEGLLDITSETRFFTFEGCPQPYAGNGLIVGVDEEGESVSPKVTADDVRAKIKFHNLWEIRRLIKTI